MKMDIKNLFTCTHRKVLNLQKKQSQTLENLDLTKHKVRHKTQNISSSHCQKHNT